MTDDAIKLEGVSAEQLTLLDDKCLVRPLPREEVRASGLFVLHGSPEHQVGSEFYAVVVRVGPGSLVREGPTPDDVAAFVFGMVSQLVAGLAEHSGDETARECADDARAFMEQRRPMRRIPPPWKPGDMVLVKQGFGVEMDLREGRHHVVERAGQYGHGILAAWEPDHVHCFHLDSFEREVGHCACGLSRVVETRLPACAACPPGERLAEAVLGGKHVYDVKIPDAPIAPVFDPEAPGAFRVGEMRPE